ncbi:MAG: exodeoxyribonuclease VII large subunit [Thiotrichales bacterium]|jgi:exodeoxyribonuclease VII large subunit|nr:exodeoxyribonuclease VII large subunit [Thiotrichales bacterium]MBT4653981.1 exodeoxyribonuclease VII large subunit [Thiotrichales bacterium]MBT6771751.1 exodeoxyribonuclease VII large subunit [Thiotrichales bacterium]MBT7438459.1 exodeoxyribonuclease VII large subunit [Thiotrichales bacterium]MBT7933781.1 exodeoxyribonuclease VII large subunit [Thiotrichales bacterium]
MFNIDEIYSVSHFVRLCKNSIEKNIPQSFVQGEISNLSKPSSGHWYFSLKDENSQIRCAFFRLNQRKIKFTPENGMSVIIRGATTLYPQRGDFQLIVQQMEPAGVGNLQMAFDQLKNKLRLEGLFDSENKKELPAYPNKIGVISSSTGSVIRDIIEVLKSRYPLSKILLYDTIVQGENAHHKIIKALKAADKIKNCDVLILARGGGSLEDLWAFNEEELARAIFHCSTPIISSIGHETDTTIADFVADFRAPTPSAAAVSATPDVNAILYNASKLRKYLHESIKQSIESKKSSLALLKLRIIDPSQQLLLNAQKLDDLELRLIRNNKRLIEENKGKLKLLISQLINHSESFIKLQKNQLSNRGSVLSLLSPLNTLSRGYTITQSKEGEILTSHEQINTKELIITQFQDGKVTSKVVNKEDN